MSKPTPFTPAAFWDALRAGRLMLPYCADCQRYFFYPRGRCPRCWSGEVSWRESNGTGAIAAFSTVQLPLNGWPAEDVPYQVTLIRLDEDVVVPGRMAEVVEGLAVGQRVTLDAGDTSPRGLPGWRVAGGDRQLPGANPGRQLTNGEMKV